MKALYAAIAATTLLAGPAVLAQESQDQAANNMEIVREKVRADKKLLVAANMELTESEAAAFWPVYEAYQKEIADLNQRTLKVIENYADVYNQGAVSDDAAKKLLDEALAIDSAEVDLRKSYVSKFSKVLPAAKVARYYQIERKIRAAINYELASGIPLVK